MGLFRTDLVSVMAIITGGAISVVASGMLVLLLRAGDAPGPPVQDPVVTVVSPDGDAFVRLLRAGEAASVEFFSWSEMSIGDGRIRVRGYGPTHASPPPVVRDQPGR